MPSAAPFEQRRKLKRLLGKTYRPLVTSAKHQNKKLFLESLTSQQAYVIRNALGVDPATFWRLSRGREFQPLPDVPVKIDPAVLNALPERPRQLGLPFISD